MVSSFAGEPAKAILGFEEFRVLQVKSCFAGDGEKFYDCGVLWVESCFAEGYQWRIQEFARVGA